MRRATAGRWTRSRLRDAAAGLLLAALALALYWPVRHYGFVDHDDYQVVVENPALREGLTAASLRRVFTTTQLEFWIPVTWVSYLVDIELFGPDPGHLHATNLLLHLAAVLSLFAALRLMTGALWPSAAVAAFLAVHPLHVESVAWITGRKDVLAAAFGFAALAAYAGWVRRPGTLRYLALLLLYALSLAAKPMLVTLPVLLLILDGWPLGRLRGQWRARLLEKAPLAGLALLSGAATLLAHGWPAEAGVPVGPPFDSRLPNALGAVFFYVAKLVLPVGLATPYPANAPLLGPGAAVAAGALLAALVTALMLLARRRPFAAAGGLWYLVALLPVAGLVQVGNQLVADRFAYFTLPGVYLAVVWWAASATGPRRRAAAIALCLALALFAAGARRQLGFWRDGESLSRRALAVTRDNWLAMNNLGTTCLERGDAAGALDLYRRALAVRPGDGLVLAGEGLALADLGRCREAVASLERAWVAGFRQPRAERRRGDCLLVLGDVAGARQAFRHALQLDPADVAARRALEASVPGSGAPP